MRKIYFLIVLISSQVLLFSVLCNSQDHGKIISRDEADTLFDSVLVSVKMPVETVQDIISKTEKNIMLKIVEDSVVVLDNNRKVLFPEGKSVSSEDVFTVYSISALKELISKSKEEFIYIEQRKEVLTITNGNFTLEFGSPCPPDCS
jgi:hypothetical protein